MESGIRLKKTRDFQNGEGSHWMLFERVFFGVCFCILNCPFSIGFRVFAKDSVPWLDTHLPAWNGSNRYPRG